jgi:murein DD-endopeptidase MepM/ murein hydrolase activator NlpD
MQRQADDYATAMENMEEDYAKQMDRAADDLNRMATDTTGNFNQIMRRAISSLRGTARKQANEVLNTFDELYLKSGPKADKIIGLLEDKFGVKFPDNSSSSPHTGGPRDPRMDRREQAEMAHGGGSSPSSRTSMTHHPMGGGFSDPERTYGNVGPHWETHHTGEDYSGATGAPIYAALPGTVVYTGYHSAYGNLTKIAHGPNTETWYAHQSRQNVASGDRVRGGQRIGAVGETGNAFGSHLHFEYRVGGVDRDPWLLLSGAEGADYSGGGAPFNMKKFMGTEYPELEVLAGNLMTGMPRGAFSRKMNRQALGMLQRYARSQGKSLRELVRTSTPNQLNSGIEGKLPPGANYGASAQGVWAALIGAGFSKIHAAGIMGNIQSESGFDPFIIQGGGHSMNPADAGSLGYGLVQWTPGSKLIPYLNGKAPSVATEVNAIKAQLAGRGSSPEAAAGLSLYGSRTVRDAALAFELDYERHAGPPQPNRISQAEAIYDRFAAEGGIYNKTQRLVVGERGPEAVLPLNERGVDFLSALMKKLTPGLEARTVHQQGRATPMCSHTTNYYSIDKGNKFTGPIQVVANSPKGFLRELREQQRHGALGQPLLNARA